MTFVRHVAHATCYTGKTYKAGNKERRHMRRLQLIYNIDQQVHERMIKRAKILKR